MPEVAAIAAIIGSAVTAGTSIYEATQTPSQPKLPTGPAPLTGPQNRAQTEAISSTLPNLQSLTGGSLSPEYAASYGATQSGLNNNPQSTGNVQSAINQFFGLSAPGDKGFTPESVGSGGGTNILDVLRRLVSGGGGGGSPTGGGGSSEDFKGLAA